MPATPVSKGAMEYVVAELKKIEDDKHGVVQVRSQAFDTATSTCFPHSHPQPMAQVKSVEAVMDRLANRNDEWSKQVMALMATAYVVAPSCLIVTFGCMTLTAIHAPTYPTHRSPTALKVNHRLLVESSTLPTVAESLALEHRTAVRMLFHPDMAAAAKAQEVTPSQPPHHPRRRYLYSLTYCHFLTYTRHRTDECCACVE